MFAYHFEFNCNLFIYNLPEVRCTVGWVFLVDSIVDLRLDIRIPDDNCCGDDNDGGYGEKEVGNKFVSLWYIRPITFYIQCNRISIVCFFP